VSRLIFEGSRVIGAELVTANGLSRVLARETIVCCGGIHTPSLLMRSGIGPAAELRALGIDVVAERRGVGRNLLEHPSLAVSAFLPRELRLVDDDVHQAQTCIRMSSGVDRTGTGDLFFQVLAKSAWHAIGRRLGTIFFWINKSYSTGNVSLKSSSHKDEPVVDFRFLSDDRDRRRMMQCVRFAAGLLTTLHERGQVGGPFPTVFSDRVKKVSAINRTNAMKLGSFGLLLDAVGSGPREALLRTVVAEAPPLGDLLADERALEAFVLKSVSGTWHASGTCRMGRVGDPAAVTDGTGRVIGVPGLRICDGSVMPTIPRANTNIPIIMIAERVADLIKQEHAVAV
jgi:5-(hydroxymethyl)furfural/furfural oxidase